MSSWLPFVFFKKNKNNNDNNNNKTPTAPNEPEKTFLFFIHQNRMKTSVVKTFNELGKHSSIDFNPIDAEIRFYNACIVKMTIAPTDSNSNNKLSLSLEYNGDISAKKTKNVYWVTPQTENGVEEKLQYKIEDKSVEANIIQDNAVIVNNDQYNPIKVNRIEEVPDTRLTPRNITIPSTKLKEILYFEQDVKTPITCYFVRHGVATHNDEKKLFKTEYNTELEDHNDPKIITAGEKFSVINKDNNIDAIFVSDLIRTQQTAGLFLRGYIGNNNQKPLRLFVLPCLHELNKENPDGVVDKKWHYPENQTTCRDLETKTKIKYFNLFLDPKNCSKISLGNAIVNLNWDYYKNFYNAKFKYDFRDYKDEEESPCANSHFLGIVLDNLNTFSQTTTGGRITKKRTTRKSSKSQKPTTPRKPRKSRKSTR